MPTTLLIADDHRIVRDGLRALLETHPDFHIVGEASDGWETIEAAKTLQPNVILMDVNMPGLNGVDATRRILSSDINSRVLALSAQGSQEMVKSSLQAGASGYLQKNCTKEELFTAITFVVAGQIYVSPAVAGDIINDYLTHLKNSPDTGKELSGREREVLQLISEGYGTSEIADSLSLSVKTIESHRQRIMNKLDIRTVAGLTKYAIKMGITSLGD